MPISSSKDNEPGKTYDIDDRRRDAALEACDGLPTEALERGIVKELYKLAAFLTVHDAMAPRERGNVVIPEWIWADNIRGAINRLNLTVDPGHTKSKTH